MNTTSVLFIIVFVVLVFLYVQNCNEGFYIQPNTIMGGAMPQSGIILAQDGDFETYSAPLELEGPGDAAWDGY